MPIQAAADAIVKDMLKPIGGEGGVIGLDAHGNVMMSFNTSGMGRGYVGADGKPMIMFTASK
jgi:beta-aspartyl-peptidase (threonine type)